MRLPIIVDGCVQYVDDRPFVLQKLDSLVDALNAAIVAASANGFRAKAVIVSDDPLRIEIVATSAEDVEAKRDEIESVLGASKFSHPAFQAAQSDAPDAKTSDDWGSLPPIPDDAKMPVFHSPRPYSGDVP